MADRLSRPQDVAPLPARASWRRRSTHCGRRRPSAADQQPGSGSSTTSTCGAAESVGFGADRAPHRRDARSAGALIMRVPECCK